MGRMTLQATVVDSTSVPDDIASMLTITLNGEARSFPLPLSVEQLLDSIGKAKRPVAVEVNREVVPAAQHGKHWLREGDAVEVVTLVGGGSPESPPDDKRS